MNEPYDHNKEVKHATKELMLLEGIYVEIKRVRELPASSWASNLQAAFAIMERIKEHRERGNEK